MQRLGSLVSHLSPNATGSSATARQIVIAEVPAGPLEAENFALEDAEIHELADGKVRVRTQALTIGAGQRAGLQGSAGYAGAVKGETNAVMSVRLLLLLLLLPTLPTLIAAWPHLSAGHGFRCRRGQHHFRVCRGRRCDGAHRLAGGHGPTPEGPRQS
jgi:hypothetical protein